MVLFSWRALERGFSFALCGALGVLADNRVDKPTAVAVLALAEFFEIGGDISVEANSGGDSFGFLGHAGLYNAQSYLVSSAKKRNIFGGAPERKRATEWSGGVAYFWPRAVSHFST